VKRRIVAGRDRLLPLFRSCRVQSCSVLCWVGPSAVMTSVTVSRTRLASRPCLFPRSNVVVVECTCGASDVLTISPSSPLCQLTEKSRFGSPVGCLQVFPEVARRSVPDLSGFWTTEIVHLLGPPIGHDR